MVGKDFLEGGYYVDMGDVCIGIRKGTYIRRKLLYLY